MEPCQIYIIYISLLATTLCSCRSCLGLHSWVKLQGCFYVQLHPCWPVPFNANISLTSCTSWFYCWQQKMIKSDSISESHSGVITGLWKEWAYNAHEDGCVNGEQWKPRGWCRWRAYGARGARLSCWYWWLNGVQQLVPILKHLIILEWWRQHAPSTHSNLI